MQPHFTLKAVGMDSPEILRGVQPLLQPEDIYSYAKQAAGYISPYGHSAGAASAHLLLDQCARARRVWSCVCLLGVRWVRKELQVLNCAWKQRRWRASVRVYRYVSSLLCVKEASSRTLGCVAATPSISFGGEQVEMRTGRRVAGGASARPEDNEG